MSNNKLKEDEVETLHMLASNNMNVSKTSTVNAIVTVYFDHTATLHYKLRIYAQVIQMYQYELVTNFGVT